MSVSELDSASIILNAGGIDDSATMPTISAGTNRVVLVFIDVYNGGGSCSLPDSITCNGRSASFIAGDDPSSSNGYLSAGLWMFSEADVSSISGQSLVSSGGSGTVKSIHVMSLNDCVQTVPANKGQARTNAGGTLTVPLTRGASSLTVAQGWTEASGSALTFSNPSRTSIINYGGRWVSVAVAADSSGTSDFTSSTVGGGYENIIAIVNFEPVATGGGQEVISINDDEPLKPGQIGAIADTTGFTELPDTIISDAAGLTFSNIGGDVNAPEFDVSDMVHGDPYPEIGSTVNITFTYGEDEDEETATGEATIGAKDDQTSVQVDDPAFVRSTLANLMLLQNGRTIATGDWVHYIVPEEMPDLAIAPNTNITSTNEGTFDLWLWVSSGDDAGKVFSYTVVFKEPPSMPASTSVSVSEGATTLGTFAADAGSAPIIYSLGGADAALFSIDGSTGVVAFIAPAEVGTGSINVTATNSAGSDSQGVSFTVVSQNYIISPHDLSLSTDFSAPDLSQFVLVQPNDFDVAVQLSQPAISAAGYVQIDDFNLAVQFSGPAIISAANIAVNDWAVSVSLSSPLVGDLSVGPIYADTIVQIIDSKIIVKIY